MSPSWNSKREMSSVIVVSFSLLLSSLFNFVDLTLHGYQDTPYVKSHLLFFSIKIRQLLWYGSLQLKLVRPLHTYLSMIINVTRLMKLATWRNKYLNTPLHNK